jgi:hypothetical protein
MFFSTKVNTWGDIGTTTGNCSVATPRGTQHGELLIKMNSTNTLHLYSSPPHGVFIVVTTAWRAPHQGSLPQK